MEAMLGATRGESDSLVLPLDVAMSEQALHETLACVDAFPRATADAAPMHTPEDELVMDPGTAIEDTGLGALDWLLDDEDVATKFFEPEASWVSSDNQVPTNRAGVASPLSIPATRSPTTGASSTPSDPDRSDTGSERSNNTKALSQAKVLIPAAKSKRKSKRDELVSLRKQVQELYAHLCALQAQSRPVTGKNNRNMCSREMLASQQSATAQASTWELIASRQLHQRRRVEHENEQLRRRFEDQRTVLRAFQRVLTKPSTMARLIPHSDIVWNKVFPDLDAAGREAMVADLEASLVGMYNGVDEVLADPRFASTFYPFRKIELCNGGVVGPSVEIVDACEYPFHYEAVASALWTHRSKISDSYFNHVISSTDDTILRTFGSTVNLPKFSGLVRATMMQRRFVESNRVVFIFSTLLDPHGVSEYSVAGTRLRYIKWMVVSPTDHVRPNQSTGYGPRTDTAVVKTLEIVTIEFEKDIPECTDLTAKAIDVIVDSSHFQHDAKQQQLENTLLEQVRTLRVTPRAH